MYNMYMSTNNDLGYPSRIGKPFESSVYVVVQTVCMEPGNFTSVNLCAYLKESDAQKHRNQLERYSEIEDAFYTVEQLDLT